jgi:hypothetical protein
MSNLVLGRRAARAGYVLGCGFAAGVLLSLASNVSAQAQQQAAKDPKPYNPPPMFTDAKPIEFTLVAPFGKLRRDRQEQTEWRAGEILFKADSGPGRVPVRLRTRGIWRKKNCEIPPLMMNFTNDSTKKTPFARLDRARFTLHCRNNDDYEQYVLQEFNLYRVQRLLTPWSYDVRLARVTYIDSEKKDTLMTRWAFFSETDEAFVARHGVKLVTTQGAGPSDVDPETSAFYGVFQYFVGNSDFSIRALHNAVLVLKDNEHFPVARDFDWSGAVNARYAVPNAVLKIRSVSERIMRGFCVPPETFEKTFALFREKKDAIYGLYRDPLMAPLKPTVVANTVKYFDEFYETINDPRRAKRAIVDACLGGSA